MTRDGESPALFGQRRDRSPPAVQWRDLTTLSATEAIMELLLPLPWLAASLALAYWHLWALALAMSFLFFLAGLRVVHGAYHYALGLSRPGTEWVMFALSNPDAGVDACRPMELSQASSRLPGPR